jgi:hypothetical protein
MILTIVCLIIGIVGFVKGRINVTKKRELRGAPMYIAAALFCLPLPLSFLVGVAIAAHAAARGVPVDQSSLLPLGIAATWGPILVALILGFTLSKPKDAPPPVARGFEVKM